MIKIIVLSLVIVLCLGYSVNAQRFTDLEWQRLWMQSQQRQQQRDIAQREINAQIEFKDRVEKLNQLYQQTADLWHEAITAQQQQINTRAAGGNDYKQDILLEKLTRQFKDKAEELWKLNRLKR